MDCDADTVAAGIETLQIVDAAPQNRDHCNDDAASAPPTNDVVDTPVNATTTNAAAAAAANAETTTETVELTIPKNPLVADDGTLVVLRPTYSQTSTFDDAGGFSEHFYNRMFTNFAIALLDSKPTTRATRCDYAVAFSLFASCMGDFHKSQWISFTLPSSSKLQLCDKTGAALTLPSKMHIDTSRVLTDCFTARFLATDCAPDRVSGAIVVDTASLATSQPLFKLTALHVHYAPRSEWDGHFKNRQATLTECSTQLRHNIDVRIAAAAAKMASLPSAS